MRNIKIDPVTGGFVLAGGQLQFVEDQDAVAQAIRCALKTFAGEYFLDPTKGVPYVEAGRNRSTNPLVLGSVVRKVILAVPDVRSVDSINFNFDRIARRLSIAWAATSIYGVPVSDVTALGA